jgi:uncharacterized protein (DUF2225 family)
LQKPKAETAGQLVSKALWQERENKIREGFEKLANLKNELKEKRESLVEFIETITTASAE